MPDQDDFFAGRHRRREQAHRLRRLLQDPAFRESELIRTVAQASLTGIQQFVESAPEGAVDQAILNLPSKPHN